MQFTCQITNHNKFLKVQGPKITMVQKIKCSSCTRIDFGGGTLDLDPMYKFYYPREFSTLNIAISIMSRVEIIPRDDKKIHLKSVDRGMEIVFKDFRDLKERFHKYPKALDLMCKAILFFKPLRGFDLISNSQAPTGSGLGASSSLLISALYALAEFCNIHYSEEEMVQIAQGIETSNLRILTGRQDYYPAVYGGMNLITHSLPYDAVNQINFAGTFIPSVADQFILAYTHEPPRYSDPVKNPNWILFENVVNNSGYFGPMFQSLSDISRKMVHALEDNDIDEFGKLMDKELETREMIVPNLKSPEMRTILNRLSKFDFHYKICGAGGGGSILFFLPNRSDLSRFKEDLGQLCTILEFKFIDTGHTLESSE